MKKEDVKVYTNLVKDLSVIMQEAKLTKLKFKHKNADNKDKVFKITIELENQQNNIVNVTPSHHLPSHFSQHHEQQAGAQPSPVVASATETDYSKHKGALLSPMVGIIYNSPNPDSPPFVEVGSTVNEGDTLLLIEAMKVFNPIKAPKSGKIVKIFVKNNTPVEFNEPLLIIE